MRFLKMAVMAVLLSACGAPDHWTWQGTPPRHFQEAIAIVDEMAPCPQHAWGGDITFTYDPVISCGGHPANGCEYPGEYRVTVVVPWVDAEAWETSLVHELGHVAFENCGIPDWDDRTRTHPSYFLLWEDAVNAELKSRVTAAAELSQ